MLLPIDKTWEPCKDCYWRHESDWSDYCLNPARGRIRFHMSWDNGNFRRIAVMEVVKQGELPYNFRISDYVCTGHSETKGEVVAKVLMGELDAGHSDCH